MPRHEPPTAHDAMNSKIDMTTSLSSTRRAPVVCLSRSQKDLWAKDIDYPDSVHSWAQRVRKELVNKVQGPKPEKGPADHGNLIMMHAISGPFKTEAGYDDVHFPHTKSRLINTDQGLVAVDYDTALAQFKTYGKRPGAADWVTTYNTMYDPNFQPKRKVLMRGHHQKKVLIPPDVMVKKKRDVSRRQSKGEEGAVSSDERIKGYDKEIKRLAASLRDQAKSRSASAELSRGIESVRFDWKGKGTAVHPNLQGGSLHRNDKGSKQKIEENK